MPDSRCPSCQQAVPVEAGWVVWCDRCEWNLAADLGPELTGRRARRRRRAAAKSGQATYDDLMVRPDRSAHAAASLAAIALACVVVAVPPGLLALALWVGGYGRLWWHWPAAILLGVIAVMVLPRPATIDEEVLVVDRARAPQLWALVTRLAAEMGVAEPDLVGVFPGANAYVTRVGWRGRRLMVIGLPLWDAFTRQQRVFVLSHELGHLLSRDTTRGRLLGAAFHVLGRMIRLLWPGPIELRALWRPSYGLADSIGNAVRRLIASPFVLSWHALNRLRLGAQQRSEFVADLKAAQLSGRAEGAAALERMMGLHGAWLRAASAARRGEDIWAEIADWREPTPRELRRRLLASQRAVDAFDGEHPPQHLRVSLVRAHGAAEAAVSITDPDADRLEAELAPLRQRLTKDFRYALLNSR